MVETREEVVEELDSHSETMRLHDFVRIVERHEPTEERHPAEQQGVDRETLYPPNWHDALEETGDLREVIRVIQEETTEPEGQMQEAVTEDGVPEQKVLGVAETVAGIDRETVRDQLKQLRKNDEIEEFASQHRNPTIHLR